MLNSMNRMQKHAQSETYIHIYKMTSKHGLTLCILSNDKALAFKTDYNISFKQKSRDLFK